MYRGRRCGSMSSQPCARAQSDPSIGGSFGLKTRRPPPAWAEALGFMVPGERGLAGQPELPPTTTERVCEAGGGSNGSCRGSKPDGISAPANDETKPPFCIAEGSKG